MNIAAPDFQLTPIDGSPAASELKKFVPSYAGAVDVMNVAAPEPNVAVAADADSVSATVSEAPRSVAKVTARTRDRRMQNSWEG
jgi:hypothetical protein